MRLAVIALVVLVGCGRSPTGPSVESYAEACESGTLPPDSILCAACYTMPYRDRHTDTGQGLEVCREEN